MADYDSDSSADSSGDIRTQVLLGYASSEPTSDEFSQIGGHPTFLDPKSPPSGSLAKCKVCNKFMSLLVQLNADLPERFPSHERRLYVWACRSKTCRRKEGSVRGFRGVRNFASEGRPSAAKEDKTEEVVEKKEEQKSRVGEALFGVKPAASAGANPFASGGNGANPFSAGNGAIANPFASASSLAAKSAQKPDSTPASQDLPETFASKARIAETSTPSSSTPAPTAAEPWPSTSSFPKPYPHSHIDAAAEYIDPTPTEPTRSNVQIDTSTDGMGVKDAFESSMDKTFQKFADRLSQNPEQILRYEYAGQPLLYSKTDAVGQRFSTEGKVGVKGIPRCTGCGAGRAFEMQLTPQMIMELERDDLGLDGMDWGTILVATCEKNCMPAGDGKTGFVEEWVGVQWEEAATHKRPT